MYMGMPPSYGSSLFNGSPMPPYDVTYPGGSGYPYNYGSRFSGGSPYRPLPVPGPPPYGGASMIGNGTLLFPLFFVPCICLTNHLDVNDKTCALVCMCGLLFSFREAKTA